RQGRGPDTRRAGAADHPGRYGGRQAPAHQGPRCAAAEGLRPRRRARSHQDSGAEEGEQEAARAARGAPRGRRKTDGERPRYMISVAAELVGMHPQTLRMYEQRGLVTPQRTAGNTRLYSDSDVERLRLIQRLTGELGLNLAGVDRVLHMEDQLDRLQRRMERVEQEMRRALDEVHRHYRRDLVLYRPPQ